MNEHRILVPPSAEPEQAVARCECGRWERPILSTYDRLVVIGEAHDHLRGGPEGHVWSRMLNDGGMLLQNTAPPDDDEDAPCQPEG